MNRDMSLEYILGALSEAEIKDFEKKICTDARLYQSAVDWNNKVFMSLTRN
jgi:anti-sigma-K factor RskA